MSEVILIDIPRGGLAGIGRDLEKEGITVKRYSDKFFHGNFGEGKKPDCIVFHYRRKDLNKLAKLATKSGIQTLIWFPSGTSKEYISSFNKNDISDIIIGPTKVPELLSKLKNLNNPARSKSDWLKDSVSSILKISRLASADVNDFTVLSSTAREIESVFPAIHCSVMTLSSERDAAMVITQGDRKEPLNFVIDLSKYPEIENVLETRKPLAIPDAQAHSLLKEVHSFIKEKNIFSILVVPIFYSDEVIGLIMLRSIGVRRVFDQVEISFCEMVAQSMAVAIRNIRLGREVAEEVRRAKEMQSLAKRKTTDLARMETMFDHASDGIIVINDKGNIKGINVNLLRLTGQKKTDIENKYIDDFLTPAPGEVTPIMKEIRDLKARKKDQGASRFSRVVLTSSGQRRYVAVRLEHLPKRREWLISLHDMTEEHELGEELRRTKEFLENVIHSSMDAIIAADMTGTIILFNKAAEFISGYDAENVIGKMSIVDFYAPGIARDIMRRIRSDDYGGKGKLEACYNSLLSNKGEEIPINMSASIMYEGGREVASVGIFQDLRERIKIEKELREAQERLNESQKKETLMALSGAASHELNQPLTSILGYLELLKRVEKHLSEEMPEHPSVASLRNATEIILQEAERMAEVVRKIGEVTEFETRDYVGSAKIMDLDRSRGDHHDNTLPIYQTVFNHIKESVIVGGADTVIRMANPAAVTLTGENPLGKSFTRYLEGVEHTKAMEAIAKVGKGERAELELEIHSSDGSVKMTEIDAVQVKGTDQIIAIYTDITEKKKNEVLLRDLSSFRELLYKNSTLPIIMYDIDVNITFLNMAAEKLFGYKLEEVKGKIPDFLFRDFDNIKFTNSVKKLRKEKDLSGEGTILKKSGESVKVFNVSSVMCDDEGHTTGFLSLIFDLTEQQAFKKEIKEKTEQITVTTEIAESIRSGVGIEEVFGGMLKNLSRIIPSDTCAICIAEEHGNRLLTISYTPEDETLKNISFRLYDDAEKQKKLLFSKTPSIFGDLSSINEDMFTGDIGMELHKLRAKGMNSIITFPLIFRDEVLGTLHIASFEKNKYNDTHLQKLHGLSGAVTMGLANVRLFNQIKQQNLELSNQTSWMAELIKAGQNVSLDMNAAEILNRLISPYVNAHPTIHLCVWLGKNDNKSFYMSNAFNYPDLKTAQDLQADQKLAELFSKTDEIKEISISSENGYYLPVLKNAKSALLVPMAALDQKLGFLVLESHHEKAFFEDDKFSVKVLSANIAGILRNLVFYSDLNSILQFQRGIIEDANALIFVLNKEGKVALVNKGLLDIVGVRLDKILGITFWEMFDTYFQINIEDEGIISINDAIFKKMLAQIQNGKSMSNIRVVINSPGGLKSNAVFNTSTIMGRDGQFEGFIAIGQNMTRFQQLEKHLMQAEKLATVGQMSAGIAHDLANPVTGIINTTTMLYRKSDKKDRPLIEQLIDNAKRIETLSRNLMSYSRPSKEEMFPVDVRAMILDSLSFSHYELSRGRVFVDTDIPEKLPLIRGIKDQLQQVFINLLTNASHACKDTGNGRVLLSARECGNNMVKISVSDNGVGIPDDVREKLFDSFFTTKPEGEGTGLGLSIVNEIVERHEGTIDVQSELGKGSTFNITLPIYLTE